MRFLRAARMVAAAGLVGAVAPSTAADAGAPPPDLMVTASPATGLVDGQIIDVTGTGFESAALLEIFECRADAVDASGCDADNAYFADADLDGVVQTTFLLDARIFDESGREFDCRQAPNACKVGIGFLLDFDQSGFALLDFDPEAPLAPAPTATVTPDRDLQDGQTVTVEGANLSSLFETFVYQCTADRPRSGETCSFEQDVRAVAAEDGTITVDYRVDANLRPTIEGDPIDCTRAPGACVIEVSQGFSDRPDRFTRVTLTFARPRPSPTTSTTVATTTPPRPRPAPPAVPIRRTPGFTG